MAGYRLPARLRFLEPTRRRLRLADPLLMAAAIAYNAFFALIPLTFAFVTALSFFGATESGLATMEEALLDVLPEDLARFVVDLIETTSASMGGTTSWVIIISLLIALYAGSRAVYAVQKALRLMQGRAEDRSYLIARGLGILFTFGAGIALVAGYVLITSGEWLVEIVSQFVSYDVARVSHLVVSAVVALWLWVLLFAVYRWGPPEPVPRALIASTVTTGLLALGTWLAAVLLPIFGTNVLAFFGAIGLILLWLYYVALVIVMVPAFTSVLSDWEDANDVDPESDGVPA